MAVTIDDVQAQTLFQSVFNRYTTDGSPTILFLQSAMTNAITLITSQEWLDLTGTDSDFIAAYNDIISPLTSLTTDNNIFYDQVVSDLAGTSFGVDASRGTKRFEQAREKEERAYLREATPAVQAVMSSGFSAPTGPANAVAARLQAEARERLVDANRSISGEMHEMYLDAKRSTIAAALGIDKQAAATLKADVDRLLKIVGLKLEQFAARMQNEVALAAAAATGLNVNVGLSVGGSVSIGGSEQATEGHDLSAGVTRYQENTNVSHDFSTTTSYSTTDSTSNSTRESHTTDWTDVP